MGRLALLACLALLLAACGLSACGDESRPREDPAVASLAELRRAMTSGPGMESAALLGLVQRAGTDLWPGTGPEDTSAVLAQKAHQDLAVIAADVARDVVRDPTERTGWLARDPDSVEIHDAYVAALSKDVAAYRSWVATEGAALLHRRIERLTAPPR